MKKILILGGKRLVGKNLIKKLLEEGNDVTVANRSGMSDFGNDVCNIVFDRNDKESIKEKICEQNWDVVYDMICYSAQNAQDIMENLVTEKYIMISSSVVYEWGENHREEEFVASTYEWFDGTIDELGRKFGYRQAYKLGKMGSEAVIENSNSLSAIRVRFPLIIGTGDHTGRMETYIDAIKNDQNMYVDNLYSRFTMVEAENAAEYLRQIKDKEYNGAINMGDSGDIVVYDLINMIANILGKRIQWDADGTEGGYNGYFSNTYNLNKMKEIGIIPRKLNIETVLNKLI